MEKLTTLALLVAAVCADIRNTSFNGMPGCKTAGEIGQAYANFHDSTHYWRCNERNSSALLVRCPNGYGFQDSQNSCVPFSIWEWESHLMPPSCPDFDEECIPSLIQAV